MTAAQPIVADLLANGQNSSICLEENCLNPFADSYLCSQVVYNPCLEETENITLCACGCGQELLLKREYSSIYKRRGVPRYIKGHNPKSEETRRKIGQANAIALKGHKQSPEAIEKTRRANTGRKPWNTGKGGTEAVKSLGEAHKGQIPWNKGIKGLHCSPQTEFKSGALHRFWRGGIRYFPYCPKFNHKLKEQIRERDNRACQLCGIKENGERLHVHHIHYDKENCAPDLIALCKSCHAKVRLNRDFYEQLFSEKLKSRGLI